MLKRRFTKRDLIRYNGKHGAASFIAYQGKVYDVSLSFLWQNGAHQALHIAGIDLTDELVQAPHGAEMLEKFPVVGELVED
ncbi:MAG: cytochrome B5 [Chloroflexi bacterium]|nr:cytochrome B5 [Chloroflexota bacterium]